MIFYVPDICTYVYQTCKKRFLFERTHAEGDGWGARSENDPCLNDFMLGTREETRFYLHEEREIFEFWEILLWFSAPRAFASSRFVRFFDVG